MADKWIDDELAIGSFSKLMVDLKKPLEEFLHNMIGYFDDSPNSILMRIVGYASVYYNRAVDEGMSDTDSYHYMIAELSKNPLAQQMFMMAGGNMMDRMAGVE